MKHLIFIFAIVIITPTILPAATPEKDKSLFSIEQSSASMMIRYAEKMKNEAPPEHKQRAERKFLLMYDVYLKTRSYAMVNKVFFILSIIFAIAVLLWPSLSIIFKKNLHWEWLRSATVQTTVTAIAALMFTFYTQYKDKQTYSETMMRHIMYSNIPISTLAIKVSEELAKIDKGFSFSSVIGGERGEDDKDL